MKKYMILLCLILSYTMGFAEEITLEWDYNGIEVDGFKLYQGVPEEDFTINFMEVDKTILGDAREVTIDVPGRPEQVTKYVWKMTAFKGETESEDSNSVSYKVVNIPSEPPINLTGTYSDSVITLAWEQPADDYEIDHWVIFRRLPDGDFIALGQVDMGQQLALTADISSLAPIGELTTIDFTVTAYRRSGVFSQNSNVVTLDIDRRQVSPVENLRLKVKIPL